MVEGGLLRGGGVRGGVREGLGGEGGEGGGHEGHGGGLVAEVEGAAVEEAGAGEGLGVLRVILQHVQVGVGVGGEDVELPGVGGEEFRAGDFEVRAGFAEHGELVGFLGEGAEPEAFPDVSAEPETRLGEGLEAGHLALGVEEGDGQAGAVFLEAADHELLALRGADEAAEEGLDGGDGAAGLFAGEDVEFDAGFGVVGFGDDVEDFEDGEGAFGGHVFAAELGGADDDEGLLLVGEF